MCLMTTRREINMEGPDEKGNTTTTTAQPVTRHGVTCCVVLQCCTFKDINDSGVPLLCLYVTLICPTLSSSPSLCD